MSQLGSAAVGTVTRHTVGLDDIDIDLNESYTVMVQVRNEFTLQSNDCIK